MAVPRVPGGTAMAPSVAQCAQWSPVSVIDIHIHLHPYIFRLAYLRRGCSAADCEVIAASLGRSVATAVNRSECGHRADCGLLLACMKRHSSPTLISARLSCTQRAQSRASVHCFARPPAPWESWFLSTARAWNAVVVPPWPVR